METIVHGKITYFTNREIPLEKNGNGAITLVLLNLLGSRFAHRHTHAGVVPRECRAQNLPPPRVHSLAAFLVPSLHRGPGSPHNVTASAVSRCPSLQFWDLGPLPHAPRGSHPHGEACAGTPMFPPGRDVGDSTGTGPGPHEGWTEGQ